MIPTAQASSFTLQYTIIIIIIIIINNHLMQCLALLCTFRLSQVSFVFVLYLSFVTVETGFNDIGLGDTSSITSDTLLYQYSVIPRLTSDPANEVFG